MIKGELAQEDCDIKCSDIDKEYWFFGEEFVGVENERDG